MCDKVLKEDSRNQLADLLCLTCLLRFTDDPWQIPSASMHRGEKQLQGAALYAFVQRESHVRRHNNQTRLYAPTDLAVSTRIVRREPERPWWKIFNV
jgi:hypothetical protein